ncbi:endolytic transglycosylase MltG [Candidatus Peregrinibacteria bacterium]|nr:endolytic transglycosylase MltG [Candidatus Peregrinibacteria bacterium]
MEHSSYRRRRNQQKRTKIWPVIAILTVLGFGWFWFQNSRYQSLLTQAVDPNNAKTQNLVVKKGETLSEIAKSLKEANLVIDEDALKKYMKENGLDRKIVAGRFMLSPNLTIPEIAEHLTDSEKSQLALTVPEGYTIQDIDQKLTDLEAIQSGEFIKAVDDFKDYDKYPFLDADKQQNLTHPLEGFLFPDTYYLDSQNFQSADLIQLMLNNFQKRLGDELQQQPERGWQEIITMASIVEKEVKTEKDIPIVAGVLWKRIDEGWLLGADATMLYLKKDRSIDQEDLKEDTPYNTRLNKGLPPGPICNPGLKSILATLHPEESPYYFYLTKPGSGEVVYARTNDEHNLNKARYLY